MGARQNTPRQLGPKGLLRNDIHVPPCTGTPSEGTWGERNVHPGERGGVKEERFEPKVGKVSA